MRFSRRLAGTAAATLATGLLMAAPASAQSGLPLGEIIPTVPSLPGPLPAITPPPGIPPAISPSPPIPVIRIPGL